MAKGTTLDDIMAAVQGITARLDERERKDAEADRQIESLIGRWRAEKATPEQRRARLHLVDDER